MFVKCPQCHTAYRIENKTLPPRKRKQNALCKMPPCLARFFPIPETGTSPEIPLIEPEAFRFAFSRDDHIVREPVNTFPATAATQPLPGTVLFSPDTRHGRRRCLFRTPADHQHLSANGSFLQNWTACIILRLFRSKSPVWFGAMNSKTGVGDSYAAKLPTSANNGSRSLH